MRQIFLFQTQNKMGGNVNYQNLFDTEKTK